MKSSLGPASKGLGAVVRTKRQKAGLSQEQLAHATELDRTYISQIERGLKSPSLRTVEALATAFGIPPHVLIRAAERTKP